MGESSLSQARYRRKMLREAREEATVRMTAETVGGTSFAFAMGFVLSLMLHLGGSMPMPVVYGLFLGTLFAVIAAVGLTASGSPKIEPPEVAMPADPAGASPHAASLVPRVRIPEFSERPSGSPLDSAWVGAHAGTGNREDDIYLDENGRREPPPRRKG